MPKTLAITLAALLIVACGETPEATNSGEPWIDARFPLVVTHEATVDVLGSGFGRVEGTVLLGDTPANVVSWSDQKVVIEAPHAATSACTSIKVVAPHGESNTIPFGYGEHGIWVPKHAFSPVIDDDRWVWTGKELIAFGGDLTGVRYRPNHETWLPLNAKLPPLQSKRALTGAKVMWTGSRVVAWLGDAGAQFDPKNSLWAPLPTTNAPVFVKGQSAAAGGNTVFVYGGLNTCKPTYDHTTSTQHDCPGVRFTNRILKNGEWQTVPDSPEPFDRSGTQIVWTGNEYLVWGGLVHAASTPLTDGIAFDPKTMRWRRLETQLPVQDLMATEVLWLDGRLLVIGKGHAATDLSAWLLDSGRWKNIDDGTFVRDGGRVGTIGKYIFVSGGVRNNDKDIPQESSDIEPEPVFALYSLDTGDWQSPKTPERIAKRIGHVAFADGKSIYIFGGESAQAESGGGRFDIETQQWTPIGRLETEPVLREPWLSTNRAPVWTGSELLIYGDDDHFGRGLRDVIRYDPATDRWTQGPNNTSLGYRARTAWTGSKLFVWGGSANSDSDEDQVRSGALFDPATNAWEPISTYGAPTTRAGPAIVSTGESVIFWGGVDARSKDWFNDLPNGSLNNGASFNLASRTWSALPVTEALNGGYGHVAIWTGAEVIAMDSGSLAAAYNPETNIWHAIATPPGGGNTYRAGDYLYRLGAQGLFVYSILGDTWAQLASPIPAQELEWYLPNNVLPIADSVFAVNAFSNYDYEISPQGVTQLRRSPCGFFVPGGHFVSTGDRILGWGAGGVSWFLP